MRSPDWPLGLARLGFVLGRDLQRAARNAGGPEALWRAQPARLGELLHLGGPELELALRHRASLDAAVECGRLDEQGMTYVGRPDERFPVRLGEIYDPPFGIFLRGEVAATLGRLVSDPVVAVVGSRRPTAFGLRFARSLSGGLARRGALIVSGLALGIDAAAHEGALDADESTVAVLASGVDRIYPRRHDDLARRILPHGLLVSEYWPSTAPAPWRFPARNRIIAGLAHAVVVVEGGLRSGALITADFALEQGRPVLAVPGSPGAAASEGCNLLIRAGAALCEGVEDVIAELADLSWSAASSARTGAALEGLDEQIYLHLRQEPLRADEIAARLGLEAASVSAALARLELAGVVMRGQGQRYWATPQQGAA